MTNVQATTTAPVAEQGAHVAPAKASSKKRATAHKDAPNARKPAKGLVMYLKEFSTGLAKATPGPRQRVNSLNPVPIRQIYERWVSRYQDFWADTLLRVKEDVEPPSEPPKDK